MEEKQPIDWKQMVIMALLIGVTSWAAMNFMSKRQSALPDKPAAADKADKKEAADRQNPAPAASEQPAAVAATDGAASSQDPAASSETATNTPQFVITQAVDMYDTLDAYAVDFFLTQPRNIKESTKPEVVESLREKFHMDWKKNTPDAPEKDSFRLTGVDGFNKCTVAAYSPDKQKFTVFHPHGNPVTVPAGDTRMNDLFQTGVHIVARHLQQLLAFSETKVEMKKESMRLPGKDKSADYFILTITSGNEVREVAAVNVQTGALEMHEMYKYNKKGKTESQQYWLARRIVWSDLKPVANPPAADWYVSKPDFEKLNCSR
jgi:hypothetical protein